MQTERKVPEIGALQQWRKEVDAGTRTLGQCDKWSRAAGAETEGRDFDALGCFDVGDMRRQDARLHLGMNPYNPPRPRT